MHLDSRVLFSTLVACAVLACSGRDAPRADSAEARNEIPVHREVAQACDAVAERFRKTATARVDVKADSFPGFTRTAKRFGCVVGAEGTLGGQVTVPFLASALPDSLGPSWTRDSTIVTNGPRGAAYALRRGDVLCLFRITWTMRVRYDTKADPPPYSANVGCAATPVRGSVP